MGKQYVFWQHAWLTVEIECPTGIATLVWGNPAAFTGRQLRIYTTQRALDVGDRNHVGHDQSVNARSVGLGVHALPTSRPIDGAG
jgi:hypothetical protein